MSGDAIRPVDLSVPLVVEPAEETNGRCDCCGGTAHTVWGYVHEVDGPTLAAYFVRWTDGHVEESGVGIDLVVGAWGEGTSPADRATVSLVQRRVGYDGSSLTVVDARPEATVAARALKRHEVLGTPNAPHVLRIVDAVCAQDPRLGGIAVP